LETKYHISIKKTKPF